MSVASIELLRAAAAGDIRRLRSLLAQGVDVNSTNKSNQTALMLAAAFKRVDIVNYLLAVGGDVEIQDELGLTAADWARQDIRIIQLLNRGPASVLRPGSVRQPENQTETKLEGVAGAILRDHTTPNSTLAGVVARDSQVLAESVSISNETIAPTAAQGVPTVMVEPSSPAELDDIPIALHQRTSPAFKIILRVAIVIALLGGVVLSYHLASSVLSTLRSRTKQDPEPTPVSAATTKPTKSAPVVGGELVGAQLFIPDAVYPPEATVASGNVTVGIQVSRKGIVVTAATLDGDASLRASAEKAALSSAFIPEKLWNKDSLVNGTITYSFLKADESKPKAAEFGLIADGTAVNNVSATVGGPLAGAERNVAIPKIPKNLTVEQESATVVVRVNRSGRVMSYRPLDSDERLRAYLIKAARSSTFDREKLPGDGQVVGTITYKFR